MLAVLVACGGGHEAAPDAGGPGSADASIPPDAPIDLNAPTDVPAVPCAATAADVYAATASPTAKQGDILACSPSDVLAQADVQSAIGDGVEATTDVSTFLIAYATRAGDGSPAASTARVYLPHTPKARPVPLAVVGHGSVGLADGCVPSAGLDDNLPLPFAARGFAAIAPDFAGLGNAGNQDYLDNRAQGWQLVDGARAIRALLAHGLAGRQVILAGYSQGGGAALSAQALFRTDGADAGELVATVAYAPEWPVRMNSFGYADILRNPDQLTFTTGLSRSSIVVLRQYAWFENWIGTGHGTDAFDPKFKDGLDGAVASQCLVPFGGYVQTAMLHTGDLVSSELRTGLVGCMDGTPACTGTAKTYYDFLIANQLPPDPQAGPTLIVQGLADQIMAPANEAACIHDELVGAGADVSTCVFTFSTHTNIMDQHASGIAWAESVLAGGPRAECDPGAQLPTCQP